MAKAALVKKQPFKGKTAIICGGSYGIGKDTAKYFVQLGGSVLIISRQVDKLKGAAEEIKPLQRSEEQFVMSQVCDTTDMDRVKSTFEAFIEQHGVPDYLFNFVGYAFPQYVQRLSITDFKNNMDVNYYGQLNPTLTLLPYFMEEKKGHIAFVSSGIAFSGIIGYVSYAPSKYALVGLTEVLRHELKPYNIYISILFPPDTDTPGFEEENKVKPEECAMISETGKVYSSEAIAEAFIEGVLRKAYFILPGQMRLLWLITRFFPGIFRRFMDYEHTKARRKLGKA